jgi:hypothetical protein
MAASKRPLFQQGLIGAKHLAPYRRFAHCISKTRMRAQRQVTISVPRPALPAAARYAPLPVPARALPEIPPPVSAGFKPELS